MEKSFRALNNPQAREAYVEAELINGLAHQIRIIRQQRGLTQKQLAEKMGTTQTTVSRLEDPSYGRYSMRSLLALSKVFDIALLIRFMAFSKFMPATWNTHPDQFKATSYENEASSVRFFTEDKKRPSKLNSVKSALSASMPPEDSNKPMNSLLATELLATDKQLQQPEQAGQTAKYFSANQNDAAEYPRHSIGE